MQIFSYVWIVMIVLAFIIFELSFLIKGIMTWVKEGFMEAFDEILGPWLFINLFLVFLLSLVSWAHYR